MSNRKIIGVTVGTTTPRANLNQTDPKKADYVRGREALAGKLDANQGAENANKALFVGSDGKVIPKEIDAVSGKDGINFTTDETLTLSDENILSVNRAFSVEQDNTLPVTAAAVYETVGNINILLATI